MKSCLQGDKARKVNCCCVFSAYTLKPVLSGGDCKQEMMPKSYSTIRGG